MQMLYWDMNIILVNICTERKKTSVDLLLEKKKIFIDLRNFFRAIR